MAAPTHEVFKLPENPNTPIWRYMDFTKFVSMLVQKGLFFSRLDKLGDPFEGSLPKLNVRDDLITLPSELTGDPKAAESYRNSFKMIRQTVRDFRAWVFVSTWHMAEHESAAMWKLYARTEEAICVRSTFAKLRDILPNDAYTGQVIYIDYDQQIVPFGNLLWPYVHKRKSFEHERELRALIPDFKNAFSSPPAEPLSSGIWRAIDLSLLIDRIYIAPTAPEWFMETVQATVKQFGFTFPVVRSALDESPLW
jgi:hypothetical protein